MGSWVHINPVHRSHCLVFSVSRLYCYFTTEGKSSTRFKTKRTCIDFYRLWISFSHVDVKSYFLKLEIFWFFRKNFPHIFSLRSCKSWLLCYELPRMISYLYIDNAFQKIFKLEKLIFSLFFFFSRKQLQKFLMKFIFSCFFCHFCPTHWTPIINKKSLSDTFWTKYVLTIGFQRIVRNLIADWTLIFFLFFFFFLLLLKNLLFSHIWFLFFFYLFFHGLCFSFFHLNIFLFFFKHLLLYFCFLFGELYFRLIER